MSEPNYPTATLLVDPAPSVAEGGARLKEVVASFPPFLGAPLQIMEGSERLESVMVEHAELGRRTGINLWTARLNYAIDTMAPFGAWRCHPDWTPRTTEQLETIWELLIAFTSHAVTQLSPSLAMITGQEWEDLPEPGELRAGKLPPFFTPWTWIASAWLPSGAAEMLKALPARRVAELAGGVAVQAVPLPDDLPPRELLDALAAFGTDYRRPVLKRKR